MFEPRFVMREPVSWVVIWLIGIVGLKAAHTATRFFDQLVKGRLFPDLRILFQRGLGELVPAHAHI
jgi:hypothetical protein